MLFSADCRFYVQQVKNIWNMKKEKNYLQYTINCTLILVQMTNANPLNKNQCK